MLKHTEDPGYIPKAGCSGIKHFLENDLDNLLLMIKKLNQHKKDKKCLSGKSILKDILVSIMANII